MSRNRTAAYINKIRAIEAPNGYKFDIVNYLYNPSYDYDYPSFVKKIDETEIIQTFRRVYYFKHWDGTGKYIAEEYTREKDGGNWQIVKNCIETVLEQSNRYNVKKLLTFCN